MNKKKIDLIAKGGKRMGQSEKEKKKKKNEKKLYSGRFQEIAFKEV